MMRTVLITGATGGLGAAVVRAFAGDRLALVARRETELHALAGELGLDEAKTLLVSADVTDGEALTAAVEQTAGRLGPLDAVVHLAGGFMGGKAVPETPAETWEQMLRLNLTSAYLLARAVLPGMLGRGRGRLVFVSSRGGSVAEAGIGAYGASKAGLEQLVRVLAEETRASGVSVNAVAPSIIDTAANRRANPNADYSAWVQPDSLAAVIRFLASDGARDISGAVVPVYGRV